MNLLIFYGKLIKKCDIIRQSNCVFNAIAKDKAKFK